MMEPSACLMSVALRAAFCHQVVVQIVRTLRFQLQVKIFLLLVLKSARLGRRRQYVGLAIKGNET